MRLVELDALRGIAAMAVVAYHYTTHYANQIGHLTRLRFGFPAGNYGVHLFFLISGFVIFMTLERTRRSEPRAPATSGTPALRAANMAP